MIIVNISNTEQVVTTEPIYMWDYGRKLKIVSEVCPLVNEIHFCDRSYENALIRIGTLIEGGLVVTIPDALLENKYEINAFLYVRDGESGKTLKQIKIPVIQRKKPEGFNPLTPTEEQILQSAVDAITAEVNNLSAMYENSMTYDELVQLIRDNVPTAAQKPMKMVDTTVECTPTEIPGRLAGQIVINDADFTENVFVELFAVGPLGVHPSSLTMTTGTLTIDVVYDDESGHSTGANVPVVLTYWVNKSTGQPSGAFLHY